MTFFLTAILHRGLRNDFFSFLQFTFSNFYLDFYSLFLLEFYFLFRLFSPFSTWTFSPFSIWTFFISFQCKLLFPFFPVFPFKFFSFYFSILFQSVFLFDRGHILDFFQLFSMQKETYLVS